LDDCYHLARSIVGRKALAAVPHCVRIRRAFAAEHEWLGASPLSGRDASHCSSRRDGPVLFEHGVAIPFLGVRVAMLDEQPIGALTPQSVMLHPHQHPATVQPLSIKRK
jgi:hypothetical protein